MEPAEAIQKKQLRNDLFYRMAVIYLEIPPLKNRIDDLDLFCIYFINKYNQKMNKKITSLSPDVFNMFKNYNWPGNVRQLKHCIESADKFIEAKHLPKYLNFELKSKPIITENKTISFSLENF